MAGIGINKFHTWHISIAVTYINHVSKRNTNILGLKIIIDGEIIYIQCSFFYSKKKLCLACIIYNLCRPLSYTIFIIIK